MKVGRENGKILVEFTEEEIEKSLLDIYGYKILDKDLFFNLLVLKTPKEITSENFNCFLDEVLERIDPDEELLVL